MIKKILLSILLVITLFCIIPAHASQPIETLEYKVIYRWGLVNKQAGRAIFSLYNHGSGQYRAEMFARTEPWADHFFSVRDTLISTFSSSTYLPISYNRIAHEGGRYAADIVKFSINGRTTSAHCTRLRRGKKDKTISKSESDLKTEGDAVDLLSSFYYLRALDLNNMKPGNVTTVSIFSGKRKETLRITYNGIETIKIDGRKHVTHKVTFTFTSGAEKNTSDPIRAWLSTSPGNIPLKLEGQLKIGKVQCIYTGH